MGVPKYITEKLKKIVSQTSGKFDDFEGGLLPRHRIIGSGDMFCLQSDNRTFIKIPRGIEVYIIEQNYNNIGKTLVYTYYGDIVLLEPEELEEIGFD